MERKCICGKDVGPLHGPTVCEECLPAWRRWVRETSPPLLRDIWKEEDNGN
jgi:hypothetical protein